MSTVLVPRFNPILTLTFTAGGTIAAKTLVKHGADDETVVAAAAAADEIIGVTDSLAVVSGQTVDVHLLGVVPVLAGAAVVRGVFLTADASGRAVTAGAGNRVAGKALCSAAAANEELDILLGTSLY